MHLLTRRTPNVLSLTRLLSFARFRSLQVRYGEFIHGLKEENIGVDRKILSELAMNEPFSFKALVDQAGRLLRTCTRGSHSSAFRLDVNAFVEYVCCLSLFQ